MSDHPPPPSLRHDPAPRLRAAREPLLEQLRAPEPLRPRRAKRLGIALAAAVLLAGGWVAASLRPDAALAIRFTPEVLELRIADGSASAEEMTEELREAGLHGAVVLVPAAPDQVGSWILWGETAGREPRSACLREEGSPPPVTRLSTVRVEGSVLRVPVETARESSGVFFFVAGRPPREGETVFTGPGIPVEHLPADLERLLAPPESGATCP